MTGSNDEFTLLTDMPEVGDFLYQDSEGKVKYIVMTNPKTYPRIGYPTLVDLRVVEVVNGTVFYSVGQICTRDWRELYQRNDNYRVTD